MKTPSMDVSMIKRHIMKGVTRLLMYFHEAVTQKGIINVVNMTSSMEIPSIPRI